MSELFDKSIRTLELPRVLQLLSEQAVSPEAKAVSYTHLTLPTILLV